MHYFALYVPLQSSVIYKAEENQSFFQLDVKQVGRILVQLLYKYKTIINFNHQDETNWNMHIH